MRTVLVASVILAVALCAGPLWAEEGPRVTANVTGPTEGSLGSYRGHEGHPRVSYKATIDTGATRFGLTHWVDTDKSHAPKVLPLEGMIGLPRPASQNWYANGFMRLYVGDEQVGEVMVKSIRATEQGARGAVVFDWERKEGTWRVTFIALPKGKSLFCSVRCFPKGEPAEWRIRLLNFPAGATRDGEREIATAKRTAKQGSNVTLTPAAEWWVAYYDNVHKVGTPKSEGPSALLYVPEDVAACEVKVGTYGVTTTLHPKGRQVRMILWDSFFGMKNAEAVAHMKQTAEAQLASLREMKFVNRAVFADEWRARRAEMEKLLAALGNPARESEQVSKLHAQIAEWVKRLAEKPEDAKPDDETQLIDRLAEQKKLLWHLRWEELFKD
ncbi:MAG: hypothetical protein GXP25_02290 [Planctomycetes bacterium]|nr:hypothetical protein [Planctomycetota bacterium]